MGRGSLEHKSNMAWQTWAYHVELSHCASYLLQFQDLKILWCLLWIRESNSPPWSISPGISLHYHCLHSICQGISCILAARISHRNISKKEPFIDTTSYTLSPRPFCRPQPRDSCVASPEHICAVFSSLLTEMERENDQFYK